MPDMFPLEDAKRRAAEELLKTTGSRYYQASPAEVARLEDARYRERAQTRQGSTATESVESPYTGEKHQTQVRQFPLPPQRGAEAMPSRRVERAPREEDRPDTREWKRVAAILNQRFASLPEPVKARLRLVRGGKALQGYRDVWDHGDHPLAHTQETWEEDDPRGYRHLYDEPESGTAGTYLTSAMMEAGLSPGGMSSAMLQSGEPLYSLLPGFKDKSLYSQSGWASEYPDMSRRMPGRQERMSPRFGGTSSEGRRMMKRLSRRVPSFYKKRF